MRGTSIVVTKDGREICKPTPLGRLEYRVRIQQMWERDNGLCCLCGQPVRLDEATFEHIRSRGMGGGQRNDCIDNNGVSHYYGNMARGSMSFDRYLDKHIDLRIHNCRGGR